MKTCFLVAWIASLLPLTLAAQTNTPAAAQADGKAAPPPALINVADEPIVKVINNVMPAVVNITAQGTVPRAYERVQPFFGSFRFVRDTPEQSIGSGLIVSADGYVLTNAHVVELAEKGKEVMVTLKSGSKYQAEIVDADSDVDLALLKIEDKTVQFPFFDLKFVSPNLLGETVVAMGSPAGYQSSASHGILSAKGRNFTSENHTYKNLLQTDAAINPGNSGGPLVDLNSSLVGINSAKLAGPAIENIGFAIPHDVVVAWATDAIAVARGTEARSRPDQTPPARCLIVVQSTARHLHLKELTEAMRRPSWNFDGAGLLVIAAVEEGSPAASDANLRQRDDRSGRLANHPIG